MIFVRIEDAMFPINNTPPKFAFITIYLLTQETNMHMLRSLILGIPKPPYSFHTI
jgi:hypothetical protein